MTDPKTNGDKAKEPIPFCKVKTYRLGPHKNIEMLTWIRTHKNIGKVDPIFIGHAIIFNEVDKSMSQPIEFQIPALTIHAAVDQFNSVLQGIIENLNKPDIVTPRIVTPGD